MSSPFVSNAGGKWSVPLGLKETSGIKRILEPVSIGIPFPRGCVTHPGTLALYSDTNDRIPLQVQATAQWRDRSIQWALLDFQASVDPYQAVSYRLEIGEEFTPQLKPSSLRFWRDDPHYRVETGNGTFFLHPSIFKPFSRVVVGGREFLGDQDSQWVLADRAGKLLEPRISQWAVESQGDVRLTLRIEGAFAAEKAEGLRFMARLSFYAGSSTVVLKLTLHNPRAARHPGGCWDLGDDGSYFFKDCSWRLSLPGEGPFTQGWKENLHEPFHLKRHKAVEIYQDSSGGPNWRSHSHVNWKGEVRQAYPGYMVKKGGAWDHEGLRAEPVLFIQEGERSIAGTIRHFWQNFPKALEAESGNLHIRLFPAQFNDLYELQGGEQKTHTCAIAFTASPLEGSSVDWIHDPLRPGIAPEWYAGTKAVRYLVPRHEDPNADYCRLIDSVVQEPNSWISRRETADEYGWRHFGEIYADHEAVRAQDGPLVSHYNNQYDVIYGLLLEYLRTGDMRWDTLMQDLARHVIDIDIYHTQEDRPVYNGGLFWHTDHYVDAATATHRTYSRLNRKRLGAGASYGGGPSNEHNYTTGLLYYYFLTGDSLAAEAVQSLADWVVNMDDPGQTVLGMVDRRPTGCASSTVEREFHGPGRGAGNSINALLDAFVLTRQIAYLSKAEELLQRCIHPRDDISRHRLEDIEHRWSYTVFLAALGKYLDLKLAEDALDDRYRYARAAFLHYAEWMVDNEIPYEQVLDRVECPTETWSAQDMRKSHVLNLAAKFAPEPLRGRCLGKARFFFEASVSNLSRYGTSTLVRPVVLLLTNGYVQAYFDRYPDESAPLPTGQGEFGRPVPFSPQGHEFRRIRKWCQDFKGVLVGLKDGWSGNRNKDIQDPNKTC